MGNVPILNTGVPPIIKVLLSLRGGGARVGEII